MPETNRRILVVDDEQNMRVALFEALSRYGHEVQVAESGGMALDLMRKAVPDLVISDIRMPGMDGIELLRQIKAEWPDLPVVIITGYATVETALEAMKRGAFDYILKPFPVEVIEETVKRVFAAAARPVGAGAGTAAPRSGQDAAPAAPSRPIIGQDARFLALLERAKNVASSKATVLILGESGTGKEVFARLIHQASDRREGPFVALNCAALPEGLLESELFGHEKGAFTGAIVTKKGKFELADGGTLLLDEIGEIPLHLQAKLLRVLQEEEVDRLGGKAPIRIDVHVVATTNRDLKEAVAKGEFRQDLYYRLNVIPLRLPALRERRDDIPLLATHFIEKHSRQYGRPFKRLSPAASERFLSYGWPGNVREMENMIERAVLLGIDPELEPWDFWEEMERPAGLPVAAPPDPVAAQAVALANESAAIAVEGQSLREVERQMILQALQKTGDNRTHAARILGISVRTLRNKLNEYRTQGVLD
ncbi:MAG: sigma-54 dependent transcriptional regulator [Thermodesulfobacteriota bacterium]